MDSGWWPYCLSVMSLLNNINNTLVWLFIEIYVNEKQDWPHSSDIKKPVCKIKALKTHITHNFGLPVSQDLAVLK